MKSEVSNVNAEEYKEVITNIKKDGYEMMVDLTAVDWYRKKEPRFELGDVDDVV